MSADCCNIFIQSIFLYILLLFYNAKIIYIIFFVYFIFYTYDQRYSLSDNSSDSFPDTSKEVMLSVISSISNIVSYTTEHMVNRLFLCIKNVIILDGYSK